MMRVSHPPRSPTETAELAVLSGVQNQSAHFFSFNYFPRWVQKLLPE